MTATSGADGSPRTVCSPCWSILALRKAFRLAVTRFASSLSSAVHEEELDADGEACIVTANNILLMLSKVEEGSLEGKLSEDFCGAVVTDVSRMPCVSSKTVYLCGDIAKASGLRLKAAKRVFIISEVSHGYDGHAAWPVVCMGRVPIVVHGVGVYYRRFFDLDLDYYKRIRSEHAFQTLTESNKPGTAHRTGIYLTPVECEGEDVHFRLLRCSSNFSGPTLNFGGSDTDIVTSLNLEVASIFKNAAPLNHVLAQIYHNVPATADKKQTKAKIKSHSDKTKDMPTNGLMAFCTFYDELERLKPLSTDTFDYGHKGNSGLTKLHFSLKPCAKELPGCTLKPEFSVTLYPNSVFLMPLSTNRLYTHEIKPAALDAHMLPTRLGYVVRCSGSEAVHKDGQTFLKMPVGNLVLLEQPDAEGVGLLRSLYAEENSSDAVIDYSKHGPVLFSMNRGDYLKPAVHNTANEFRSLMLRTQDNLFEELLRSVQFEQVGKGRHGTVLTKPEGSRGTPIVRTTTKYGSPAHSFGSVHERLAQNIQECASLPIGFNNALIELYNKAYTTMGFHSDQELDLADGSSIAVFSCYQRPEFASPPRKLVVESKEPGGGTFEVPLVHNSVVVFTLETNRRFRHKIVLDTTANPPENQWLGVTFRTSKTFIQFCGGRACLEDGTPLALANDAQSREFRELRGSENRGTDFKYPRLTYTTSESDMMPPTPPSEAG